METSIYPAPAVCWDGFHANLIMTSPSLRSADSMRWGDAVQFPDGEGGSESLVEFMQLEWQGWDVKLGLAGSGDHFHSISPPVPSCSAWSSPKHR